MEKPSLYIGTKTDLEEGIDWIPFIKTVPKSFELFSIRHQFADLKEYTHIIFTSKNTVQYFFQALKYFQYHQDVLKDKIFICIGEASKKVLMNYGSFHVILAKKPTQEGIVDTLSCLSIKTGYLFYPRSSRARPFLTNTLKAWGVRVQICDLYDTVAELPSSLPDLTKYKEVIFSSPSTIEAFSLAFSSVPKSLKLKAIGPITEYCLKDFLIKKL